MSFTLAAPAATFAWDAASFDSGSEAALVAPHQPEPRERRAEGPQGRQHAQVRRPLAEQGHDRPQLLQPRHPRLGKVWDKLHDVGYCYNVAGENIGWNNYPDDIATSAIHSAFMDSPGHRDNILGKTWDVIGIGAYKGPTGKKMWTVLFADKCGSTPAPTPKPTPKPKPKATPKPAPKATVKPAAKPAADPTTAPAVAATPEPTPELIPDESPSLRDELAPPSLETTGPSQATVDRDTQRDARRQPRRRRRGRHASGRSDHLGRTARDDRRWGDRLLLRRLMMAIATRTPRPVAPGPVRPATAAGDGARRGRMPRRR